MLFKDKKPSEVYYYEIEDLLELIRGDLEEYNPSGKNFQSNLKWRIEDFVDTLCKRIERHHFEIEYKMSIEASSNMIRTAFAVAEIQNKE